MKNFVGNFILKSNLNKIKCIDLIWLIILPIVNINYVIAAKFIENGKDISLSIDKKIPYISLFIIPYIYWYIFILLGFIYFLSKDRKRYLKAIIVMTLSMCICYAFYYIYPVEITRPVVPNDTILNRLVNLIYKMDKPLNCFPSIHVLNTYIIMRYTKIKDNKLWFIYTNIIGVLIILSTVFIKQHFILDGIASIIISEIFIFIFKKVNDRYIENSLNLPYKLIYMMNKKEDIT